MNWNWRVIIIVSATAKPPAEQAAREINSTGPDYQGDVFTVPLSLTGLEPVTHWALYTSATDQMVAAMAKALPQIGGAAYWRHDIDGTLVASNVTEANGQSWGWGESLAAAGLQAVNPPMPV